MTDEWKVGDLALCIDAHTPTCDGFVPTGIVEGALYRVYGVGTDDAGDLGLFLDETESAGYAGGYLAKRFRKIHPHIPDEEDREIIRLMEQKPTEALT